MTGPGKPKSFQYERDYMRVKGVIFDLDGTLIDSEDIHLEAWNKLIETHGQTPPPHWHDGTVGMPDTFARDKACRLMPALEPLRDTLVEEKQVVYRALADEKGRALAFPGVEESIVALKKAGIGLAVGTNSVLVNTRSTLTAAGLIGYFDILVTFDAVENGKPAPDIYLAAAQKLGLAPADCMVLEDSPAGLQAARAAGCMVTALATSTGDTDTLVPRDYLYPTTAEALDWILSGLNGK